mgnify:CR=1 FL=1
MAMLQKWILRDMLMLSLQSLVLNFEYQLKCILLGKVLIVFVVAIRCNCINFLCRAIPSVLESDITRHMELWIHLRIVWTNRYWFTSLWSLAKSFFSKLQERLQVEIYHKDWDYPKRVVVHFILAVVTCSIFCVLKILCISSRVIHNTVFQTPDLLDVPNVKFWNLAEASQES